MDRLVANGTRQIHHLGRSCWNRRWKVSPVGLELLRFCIEVELGLLVRGPTTFKGTLTIEVRGLASILSTVKTPCIWWLSLLDSLLYDSLRRLLIGDEASGLVTVMLRRSHLLRLQ